MSGRKDRMGCALKGRTGGRYLYKVLINHF